MREKIFWYANEIQIKEQDEKVDLSEREWEHKSPPGIYLCSHNSSHRKSLFLLNTSKGSLDMKNHRRLSFCQTNCTIQNKGHSEIFVCFRFLWKGEVEELLKGSLFLDLSWLCTTHSEATLPDNTPEGTYGPKTRIATRQPWLGWHSCRDMFSKSPLLANG